MRLFNDLKRHAARPPYFSKQQQGIDFFGNPAVIRLEEGPLSNLDVLTFDNSLPAILCNCVGIVDVRGAFYTDYGNQKVEFHDLNDDQILDMSVESRHGNFGKKLTHEFSISKKGFELMPECETN